MRHPSYLPLKGTNMRTRTEGAYTPGVVLPMGYMENYSGNYSAPEYHTTSSISSGSSTQTGQVKTMHDEVSPDFERQSGRGVIFNNAMDMTTTTKIDDVVSVFWDKSYWTNTLSQCRNPSTGVWVNCRQGQLRSRKCAVSAITGAFLTTPVFDVESMKSRTLTAAWAKCQTSEIAALVTLAELEKTIQSLSSIFRRCYRIGKAIKKGRFGQLKGELTAKQLSDRWMEARYAIRPMIYDAKGILSALKKRAYTPRFTFRDRELSSDATTQSGTVTPTTILGSGSNDFVAYTKQVQRTVIVKSGVLAAVDEVTQASIWGLDQPFEALWELVPFSFVVDWFFNVGKTIAAWTPNPGLRPLASWTIVDDTITRTNHITGSWTTWNVSGANNPVFRVDAGVYQEIIRSRYRLVNPALSVLPRFDVRLNGAKLLDLAIMMRKQFL